MVNSYKFLGLEKIATAEEILTRIDIVYNDARRFVTHHEPAKAQGASQALLILEEARTVLLDPVRRSQYDLSLGLGNVDEMADPTAQVQGLPFIAARPLTSNARAVTEKSSLPDGWLCSKCQMVSPTGTRYCKKRGQIPGKPCPKCESLVEANIPFCPQCGTNIREYERKIEIQTAEEERRRITEQKRQAELQSVLGPMIQQAEKASSIVKTGCDRELPWNYWNPLLGSYGL